MLRGKDLLPEQDPIPNSVDLFHIALLCGDLPRVQHCVDKHLISDINGGNAKLPPYLLVAVTGGHSPVVKFLLERGANAAIRSPGDNVTALHIAAMTGNAENIRLLLSARAEVDAVDKRNATPLLNAVESCQETSVKELLLARPNPFIVSAGQNNLVGASINSANALQAALIAGQIRIFSLLLDYCASRHREEAYHPEAILNHFAAYAADLREKALAMYSESMRKHSPEAAQLLDTYLSKIRLKESVVELMEAATKGLLQNVKDILDRGVDINVRDERAGSDKRTALMVAAANGHIHVVNDLLDRGADPDLLDAKNQPTWRSAIHHTGCMIAIIRRTKDKNKTCIRGGNSLSYAFGLDKEDVIRACMELRVSPFATYSAFNYAVVNKRYARLPALAEYMASFYLDKDPACSQKEVFYLIDRVETLNHKSVNFCRTYLTALLKQDGAADVLARFIPEDYFLGRLNLSVNEFLAVVSEMTNPADKLAVYDFALADPATQPNFFNKLLQQKSYRITYKSTLSSLTDARAKLLAENLPLQNRITNSKDIFVLLETAITRKDNTAIEAHLERLVELYLINHDAQIKIQLESLDKKYSLILSEQFEIGVEAIRNLSQQAPVIVHPQPVSHHNVTVAASAPPPSPLRSNAPPSAPAYVQPAASLFAPPAASSYVPPAAPAYPTPAAPAYPTPAAPAYPTPAASVYPTPPSAYAPPAAPPSAAPYVPPYAPKSVASSQFGLLPPPMYPQVPAAQAAYTAPPPPYVPPAPESEYYQYSAKPK